MFFGPGVDIDVVLEDTDDRAMVDVKMEKNRREKAPLYMDGESVKGAVTTAKRREEARTYRHQDSVHWRDRYGLVSQLGIHAEPRADY